MQKKKTQKLFLKKSKRLTLKMRFLLVLSQAKPPLKCIVQTRTKTSPARPNTCTTYVNGVAGTLNAISSLNLSLSLFSCPPLPLFSQSFQKTDLNKLYVNIR